jgi:hypothetical protein
MQYPYPVADIFFERPAETKNKQLQTARQREDRRESFDMRVGDSWVDAWQSYSNLGRQTD